MNVARVWATWSNVLWSSLRTITRHLSSNPEPGPWTRGSSTVWLMARGYPANAGSPRPLDLVALLPIAVQAVPWLLRRNGLQIGVGRLRVKRRRDLLADVRLELAGVHL